MFCRVMAIIELASSQHFDCSSLVFCLDRLLAPPQIKSLVRDLGWVGFNPVTLNEWLGGSRDIASPRWLFLAMEL